MLLKNKDIYELLCTCQFKRRIKKRILEKPYNVKFENYNR